MHNLFFVSKGFRVIALMAAARAVDQRARSDMDHYGVTRGVTALWIEKPSTSAIPPAAVKLLTTSGVTEKACSKRAHQRRATIMVKTQQSSGLPKNV